MVAVAKREKERCYDSGAAGGGGGASECLATSLGDGLNLGRSLKQSHAALVRIGA